MALEVGVGDGEIVTMQNWYKNKRYTWKNIYESFNIYTSFQQFLALLKVQYETKDCCCLCITGTKTKWNKFFVNYQKRTFKKVFQFSHLALLYIWPQKKSCSRYIAHWHVTNSTGKARHYCIQSASLTLSLKEQKAIQGKVTWMNEKVFYVRAQ